LKSTGTNLNFTETKKLAETNGVFTMANKPEEEVEHFFKSKFPKEYRMAEEQYPGSKALKGRYLGTLYQCPDEVNALYDKILKHFGL